MQLAREGQELAYSLSVKVYTSPPSAVEFLRDCVSPNLPCVIKGGCQRWPAYHLWTLDYLCEKLGELELSVEATPNGRGTTWL